MDEPTDGGALHAAPEPTPRPRDVEDAPGPGTWDDTVRIYVSADAPEWTGTVDRDPGETDARHAERTEILRALFGWNRGTRVN